MAADENSTLLRRVYVLLDIARQEADLSSGQYSSATDRDKSKVRRLRLRRGSGSFANIILGVNRRRDWPTIRRHEFVVVEHWWMVEPSNCGFMSPKKNLLVYCVVRVHSTSSIIG